MEKYAESVKYLQASLPIFKAGDKKKYKESVIRLIEIYKKDENL